MLDEVGLSVWFEFLILVIFFSGSVFDLFFFRATLSGHPHCLEYVGFLNGFCGHGIGSCQALGFFVDQLDHISFILFLVQVSSEYAQSLALI